jgi:hypothetical protein
VKGEGEVRIYVGGIAVALAIAAIGCGSGGDTTQVALTRAQFIKRGDAVCRTAQKKKEKALAAFAKGVSKEGKELGTLSAKELDKAYVTLALPPVKEASIELGELTAPAGDVSAEKLVDSLAMEVEEIEEVPRRAFEKVPYTHVDKLAYEYGFKVCRLF